MSVDLDQKRELLIKLLAGKAAKPVEIAIIGISGRYPQAETLAQFWDNLCKGKNCISDVPEGRWDWRQFTSDAADLSCRRGGFIADVDKFDPLFFGISPREAERMDPQERVFLESTWHAMEDAGYTPDSLNRQQSQVGVFAGVMNANYAILGSAGWQENHKSNRVYACNPTFWSIANRVSFSLDFTGPSFAVDSACSSSLTAIHLACEALRRGECDYAFAGGVNLILHPAQLDSLAKMNMLSKTGNCRSFGAGADGFTDGEGVGVVLLKPLPKAIADGDNIQAIISGSALNSGGKTSGYTVPNPNAQAALVAKVIRDTGIDARDIAYIEAHGTGTSLGDPIEVRGLTKAFKTFTSDTGFCALGSVKANIGHLEAAAGVSALTKVLLQFKHRKLVPSINADELNPAIDFSDSPFYLQQTLNDWPATSGQYGAISSFGAGGANAHLLLRAYTEKAQAPAGNSATSPVLVYLSAATQEQLKHYAATLEGYVVAHGGDADFTLANLAYTLAVGRVSLVSRLAILATDLTELTAKLQDFAAGERNSPGVFVGEARDYDAPQTSNVSSINPDILQTLAKRWVNGEIEKSASMFKGARRISLPGYPFLRESYWLHGGEAQASGLQAETPQTPQAEDPSDIVYFSSKWMPATMNQESGPQTSDQGTLLFIGENFDIADLAEREQIRPLLGDRLCWVMPGSENTQLKDNRYSLSTSNQEAMFVGLDQLLEGKTSVSIIYGFCRGLRTDPNAGIRTLLWLTQYLVENRLDHSIPMLVWNAVSGGHEDIQGFATAGFVKSLQVERPTFKVKHVSSIGCSRPPVNAGKLYLLLHELQSFEPGERVIRHENGKRFVEKIALQKNVVEGHGTSSIVAGGTYLITGGAGGLGSIVARNIAIIGEVNLVLTGRSELDAAKQTLINELRAPGNEVIYIPCDVTNADEVATLLEKVESRFGGLTGIIHSAGQLQDSLVQNKAWPDFAKVIDTKSRAIVNLDSASAHLPLDFFLVFSSISAMLGNMGQTDYAFGNSYLDNFVNWRNELVTLGERKGRSMSINWPIWEQGGMHIDAALLRTIAERIGVEPLPTPLGIAAFFDVLASGVPQVAPVYGKVAKIADYLNEQGFAAIPRDEIKRSSHRTLHPTSATSSSVALDTPSPVESPLPKGLQPALLTLLRQLTSAILDIPDSRIRNDQSFGDYGFDSITVQEFANGIRQRLGVGISPAVFFSQNTLTRVAAHLQENHLPQLLTALNFAPIEKLASRQHPQVTAPVAKAKGASQGFGDIAIIGAAGILPGAENLEAFWQNLQEGVDAISEIPPDRWAWRDHYGAAFGEANKSNSKWGGFIRDVDKFDYSFFGLSSREADFMDPQQRLFVQTAWHALEHSGYNPLALGDEVVGVFAGVEFSDYKDLLDQYGHYQAEMAIGNAHNMIPNRVSYFLDLRGPSEAVDTACSSSLVAINRAVRSIQSGESSLALAGGISLTLSPKTMIGTSQLNIYSPDGRCKTLDKNANGYVKGEGVGLVVLKSLERAIADNDNILAVIKSSRVNHGGRSNSITAPNPDAQSDLLYQAYRDANVSPAQIAYIEMHGTGTQLGDPVEVEGIKGALTKFAQAKATTMAPGSCGLGSVKTNIGHLEPAAGIAGLLKVMLSLQHKQLPPSLHFEELNPLIHLQDSPLYVVDQLRDLPQPRGQDGETLPLVAGVSSFGFGGSNAHLVLAEWRDTRPATAADDRLLIVPLSAKSEWSLRQLAKDLYQHLSTSKEAASLADLAFTLQLGRAPLSYRLAILCKNVGDLLSQLQVFIAGETSPSLFVGAQSDNTPLLQDLTDSGFQQHIMHKNDPYLAAKWWSKGLNLDWARLYPQPLRRLPLPVYPFEKTSCWIPASQGANPVVLNSLSQVNKAPHGSEEAQKPAPATTATTTATATGARQDRLSLYILDRVAELSGKPKAEIKPKHNLALDLGLDSIKMMGLVNELIARSTEERVRGFNKLGMIAIMNKARTFEGLLQIFQSSETDKPADTGTQPTPHQAPAREEKSASPAVLDAQAIFLPAHFLCKSSALCSYIEVKGELDLERVQRSWQALVARHPALQLQFHWPQNCSLLGDIQLDFVDNTSLPKVAYLDIGDQNPAQQRQSIEDYFAAQLNRQWPLDAWPLHQVSIIRQQTDSHLLVWSNEHLIADGLSNQTALRELLAIYQALGEGRELAPSAISTREEYAQIVSRLNHFQEEAGAPSAGPERYEFNPESSRKNLDACRFAQQTLRLPAATTEALYRASASMGQTMNTLLTGAFLQTLVKFDADRQRIVLQVPTSGRLYQGIELGDAIGCFAQNIPLSISVDQIQGPLQDLLRAIARSLDHDLINGTDRAQTRAMGKMIESLPVENRCLPESTLAMLMNSVKSNLYFPFTGKNGLQPRYGDLTVTDYRAGTSNSPGTIDLLQEIHLGSLHVFLNYDASYFSGPLMKELLDCYQEQLQQICQQPLSPAAGATPLTSNDASARLLASVEAVMQRRLALSDFGLNLELDLGIDSLAKIRLINHLQSQTPNRIKKSELARCQTLAAMQRVLLPESKTNATDALTQAQAEAPAPAACAIGPQDLPIHYIIRQCQQTPDALAVTHFDGQALTYSQLHEDSNKIANLLMAKGVKKGDYIGLICHRGPKMITAIVAILKCGAAYVPMDPVFPAHRKEYILQHAKITTLLSESALAGQVSDCATAGGVKRILLLDAPAPGDTDLLAPTGADLFVPDAWKASSVALPPVDIQPDDDMVVLFTSGSTGNPKGVVLHHTGYANRLMWHQNAFQLQPGDKVAQKTSCSFDVAIWEHLWPIMYGGVVCAVEKETVTNPWEFADWLQRENIAVAHFVPSMFNEFVNSLAGEQYRFPALRWLIFSGEALPTASVQNWIDEYGLETGLCNLYGPTEASIDVSYHFIENRPADNEPIPIGKAVDNTQLFCIDEKGERLAPGAMGELCLAGIQLAKGYLYEPELTAKAFVKNRYPGIDGEWVYRTGDLAVEREDGSFEYHGRLDSQVKLRGFRVELGEIENVATGHPDIEEAAALVIKDELTLCYAGTQVSAEEIKNYIGRKCPGYMIPQRTLHYLRLPKNSNGKLDRKALLQDINNNLPIPDDQLRLAEPVALPLGPAQKWIFSYFDAPYSWWGYSYSRLPENFDAARFTQALNLAVQRHDALRTQFFKDDTGLYMRQVFSCVEPMQLQECQLQGDSEQQKLSMREDIRKRATHLVPEQWPLFSVVRYTSASGEGLAWIAHHLISDMISGYLIEREVWQHYERLLTPDLAHTPLPAAPGYSDYVDGIQALYRESDPQAILNFWKKYSAKHRNLVAFPHDLNEPAGNIEASAMNYRLQLPRKIVAYLQTDGREFFESSLYHLLAACLYKMVAITLRRSWVVISHKLNGRHLQGCTSNFFESAGNFAINVPVGISIRRNASIGEVLHALQLEMDNLPLAGLSYDWIAEQLPANTYTDSALTGIRINYLGDISPSDDGEFALSERLAPALQKRTVETEFFFYSANNDTYLDIAYSSNLHSRETIERLANRYLDQLNQLAEEVIPELFLTN